MLQAIEEPFILAVKSKLGIKYSPYLNQLYRKTIHFILTTLVIGFHQVVKKSNQANDDFLRRNNSSSRPTYTSASPPTVDERRRPTDVVGSKTALSRSSMARTATASRNRIELISSSQESIRHQSAWTEKEAARTVARQEHGSKLDTPVNGITDFDDVRAVTGNTWFFDEPSRKTFHCQDSDTVQLPGQATPL